MEHTRGPWDVGQLDRNGQRIVRAEHIEIATCWHHSVASIEREMEANARLIAAAPEMLEFCEYLVGDNVLDFHTVIGMARSLIAKATGQLEPEPEDAWEARVRQLEAEGLTRSDAQAVADAEPEDEQERRTR